MKKYMEEIKRLDKMTEYLNDIESKVKEYPSIVEKVEDLRNIIKQKRKEICLSSDFI